jgi:hypothetical protein
MYDQSYAAESAIVTADNIRDTLFLIVLDLSKPWELIQSLSAWLKILQDNVRRLGLPESEIQKLQQSGTGNCGLIVHLTFTSLVEHRFRSYTDVVPRRARGSTTHQPLQPKGSAEVRVCVSQGEIGPHDSDSNSGHWSAR